MNGTRMRADAALRDARLTREIIGAFFEVYRTLGYGFSEVVYQRALAHELTVRSIATEIEAPIDVWYKGVRVGVYRADLLVEHRIVIETKVTPRLTEADQRQLISYLHATALELGMLLHFGPRPMFKRLVCSEETKSRRRSRLANGRARGATTRDPRLSAAPSASIRGESVSVEPCGCSSPEAVRQPPRCQTSH